MIAAALRAARLWSAIGLGAALLAQLPQIPLLVALAALSWWPRSIDLQRRPLGTWLAALAALGFAWIYLQAYVTPVSNTNAGIGIADSITLLALLFCATSGLALRGAFRGDAFTAGAAGLAVLLVVQFTLVPLMAVLAAALKNAEGAWSFADLLARLSQDRLWSLACLAGGARCGVAWNTLFLALLTAGGCTMLGLAFALVVTRSNFPARRAVRLLTVLPIVTPPFVIGMGLILVFGRAGLANQLLEWAFGFEPSRWIYGLPGVLLAQLFAFTPVAFLVLVGVVEGVSPTMEEAAQTLRADAARTFRTVSLPLMRPGIANAFLISFIESIADFGNPIVLGGNFGVLSTEIYFSIVGAQLDQGRAAALALVLLAFALSAFALQRRVLGGRSFVTVTGKGETGLPVPLPRGARRAALTLVLPWMLLTVVIYSLALIGGFVETWGRDYSFTFKHFVKAFELSSGAGGLVWSGAAWNSFWTTVVLAAIAAPLTAGLGLVVAWLIARQPFAGRGAFEFMTLLSFAVPGTIIGIAYVIAFNVPPIEITGTALVIVLCLVFRNLPVGVRAGVAAMSQLDRSLDEASLTLRATGGRTLARVVLPLLRPAIAGALVYSFVRAMTTVSAVIFLVSAEYDLATAYIIGRVINGDYGVALAYCTVLILLMVTAIVLIQWLVGARRLGRKAAP
ncbi:MAG: iron ABC transporter permease, partial [Betaproteobacteria bacterium]